MNEFEYEILGPMFSVQQQDQVWISKAQMELQSLTTNRLTKMITTVWKITPKIRIRLLKVFSILDGYTTGDITYLWDPKDPVQLAQNLNLPRFNIEKYSSSYCNVKTNTGDWLRC